MLSKGGMSWTSSDRQPGRLLSTSGSHAGVTENEVSKRDCQAETLVIQTEAPTQLLTDTKYEVTEEDHVNTLLVQTETATQLFSNEVQQETQLIDGDMDGFTLVIHSDGEGSGDTEVLPDNVDLHCNSPCCEGDDEAGFTSRDTMLSDGNRQYLKGPGATSALASMKCTDVELENAEDCKENCDSDATTEEVEAEDAGSLEAVAESVSHCGQRLIGGTCHLDNVVDPALVSNEKIDGEQRLIWSESSLQSTRAQQNTHVSSMQTPKATVVDEVMNNLSPHLSILRSRSGSIGSVRAASLRASGLRAAARNTLTARDGNGNKDKYDSDSTIELTPEIVEDLLPYSKALKEKKSNRDLTQSISVSFESITPNTEKAKSQTAFVSHTKSQQHDGASPISKAVEEGRAFACEKCEVKSYCRKPHGQKVRKLSFESNKISDKTPASEPEVVLAANKEEDSANPAINEFGGMGERGSDIFPEKTVESTHGPRGELPRNLISVPSGFMSASTNLSYLESQEPGEESQLNALNVVDKLVWLNATGMFQDSGPNIVSQQNCVKASQKAVQSLAHTVEINNIQDKMGVYDWVDSQQDDIRLSSDAKGDSAPRKKGRVSRLVKGRKSQAVSQQNNITSRFQAVNRSDDIAVNKEKATMASGRKVSSNMKAPSQHNQSMAPQTLLAAQSRGRRRIGGTGQTQKKDNISSLEKCKNREQNKPTKESSKLIEDEVSIGICPSQAGDNEKYNLQHGVDSTHKGEKESLLGSQIGSDTQMAIEAIDMLRDGLVTHEVSAERKGKRQSKVDVKYNQNKTPEGSNVKETNLRKGRVLKNGAGQETKRHQTRSVKRESTTSSKPKGGKRVSWVPLEEKHRYNTEKEDNTIKEEFVKRGLTTRSKAQDLANMLADSRTDEPCRPQNVKNNGSNKKRRSKMQGKKQDKTSHSYEQVRRADSNVLGLDQPSVKRYSLKMRKGGMTQQQPTTNIGQEDTVNEVGKGINKNYNSSASLMSDNGKKTSPLHCSINKKDNKRKREAADKSPLDVLDSVKLQSQECLPNFEGSSIPRKRRGSLYTPDSKERNTMAAVEEETNSAPHELKNRAPNQKDADTERELAVPAIRTTKASKRKSIRQHKKAASSEPPTESGFSLIVEEGRKRKRERGCICVLFSHSLSEETSKNQKKILVKLGGHLALSAADCTHFIADCFVRTRNMLESMAAGKPVVTSLWLENCGQAHYFVDEKNYILRDAKKEKELGFSMHSSLAAAQHKPVLQGLKVLIGPKTTPDQGAMTSIIQSAGGQVLESMSSFSKIDSTLNGIVPIVIANEKDREFCLPFVERGFKVYSTELILSGIVSQNLDFTRNQLYHGQQKRSSRGASTFHV